MTKPTTFLRLSGSSSTCFAAISVLTLASSVCSKGPDSDTVTCSEAPMVKPTFSVRESPTLRTIPVCFEVLNPAAFACNVYVPAGSKANENSPAEPAVATRVMPFSELVMVIVAFGTRAPDGSEMVPERDAVELNDWAHIPGPETTPTTITSSLIANLPNHTLFKGAPSLSCMADLTKVWAPGTTRDAFPAGIGFVRTSLLQKMSFWYGRKKTLTVGLSARYSTVLF